MSNDNSVLVKMSDMADIAVVPDSVLDTLVIDGKVNHKSLAAFMHFISPLQAALAGLDSRMCEQLSHMVNALERQDYEENPYLLRYMFDYLFYLNERQHNRQDVVLVVTPEVLKFLATKAEPRYKPKLSHLGHLGNPVYLYNIGDYGNILMYVGWLRNHATATADHDKDAFDFSISWREDGIEEVFDLDTDAGKYAASLLADQNINKPETILTTATDMASAIANSNGVPTIVGNPDDWKLINKFVNGDKTLMRSTKAYEIEGVGVLVQISTDVKGNVAEALQFIPQAKLKQNEGDPKSWSIVADTPTLVEVEDVITNLVPVRYSAVLKMRVQEATLNDDGESGNFRAEAVVDGSPENEDFFRWTPGGVLQFSSVNTRILEEFEEGDEIYVTLTKAHKKPL